MFTIYSSGEAEGAGPPPVVYSHLNPTFQCPSLGLRRGRGRIGRSCKTSREGMAGIYLFKLFYAIDAMSCVCIGYVHICKSKKNN